MNDTKQAVAPYVTARAILWKGNAYICCIMKITGFPGIVCSEVYIPDVGLENRFFMSTGNYTRKV